ncbi:MAG: hypothetical protein HZC36_13125 [Armatimonadetes bacterium]|nr:hypothetical protein [Armatimonadota bacterium]
MRLKGMKPMFFMIRDWWSQWAVDRAGEETGRHRPLELRTMLGTGEITPNTWLRHIWTRRYALAGEVLFMNDLASEEEFEKWFPVRRVCRVTAGKPS